MQHENQLIRLGYDLCAASMFQMTHLILVVVIFAQCVVAADRPIDAEYTLPATATGSRVGCIVPGPDGNMWFTYNGNGIGKIDTLGRITVFPQQDARTLYHLTVGPDGNFWVLEQPTPARILILDTNGKVVNSFLVPGGILPDGIIPIGANSMCFVDFNLGTLWTVSTSGQFWQIGLPENGSAGFKATWPTVGPDGNIWVGSRNGKSVARFKSLQATSAYTEIPLSSLDGPGIPFIFVGSDGLLSFTTATAWVLGKFNPSSNEVTVYPCDVADLSYWAISGPDNNTWGIKYRGSSLNKLDMYGANSVTKFEISGRAVSVCKGIANEVWIGEETSTAGIIGRIHVPAATHNTSVSVTIPGIVPAKYVALGLCTSEGRSRALGLIESLQKRNLMRAFGWSAKGQCFFELNGDNASMIEIYDGLYVSSTVPALFNLDGKSLPSPFKLRLLPGWNLVSVPALTDGLSTDLAHRLSQFNVFDAKYEVIAGPARTAAIGTVAWYWNGSAYEAVTTLESGKAYWIKNNTTQTLTLTRMNTLTGGVVFMSDSERTGGSGTGTGSSGGGGGSDPTELPPPVPALSAEAADQSHPCGTGSTVGLVLAMSSLLALRLRRRAA